MLSHYSQMKSATKSRGEMAVFPGGGMWGGLAGKQLLGATLAPQREIMQRKSIFLRLSSQARFHLLCTESRGNVNPKPVYYPWFSSTPMKPHAINPRYSMRGWQS